MPNAEYESRIGDLVRSWREDVDDGLLVDDVLPATRIFAHASLQGMTDEYDVAATFPMLPDGVGLPDHYGNALFARLGSSSTSVRNALQGIQARMDCHSAFASARRAHESLWQVFWLANPELDADTRIRRLLTLTRQEIGEALRFYSYGINAEIESRLQQYESNIEGLVGREVYRTKDGRSEYREYFAPRFNDPLPPGLPRAPADVKVEEIEWSMMSNMTHPNVVFDWVLQIQKDSQNRMDRLQVLFIFGAMGMASNISTFIMEQAHIASEQQQRVNATFQQLVYAAQSLLELRRN